MGADTKGMKFWSHGSVFAVGGADSAGLKFWSHGSVFAVGSLPNLTVTLTKSLDDATLSATATNAVTSTTSTTSSATHSSAATNAVIGSLTGASPTEISFDSVTGIAASLSQTQDTALVFTVVLSAGFPQIFINANISVDDATMTMTVTNLGGQRFPEPPPGGRFGPRIIRWRDRR